MKKLLLAVFAATVTFTVSKAQNTFPASGYVGIGTTNPLTLFDTKLTANQHIQFTQNVNGAYFGAAGIVSINDSNTAYTPLGFYASNFFFGGGNFGIGTTSPGTAFGEKLSVQGGINVLSGNTLYISNLNNTNAAGLKTTAAAGTTDADLNLYGGAGIGTGITIKNYGSVGIGTTNPLTIFDTKLTANQHIQFAQNVNGAYFGAAGIISINDNNTAYTPLGFYSSNFFFGGGNVGIGTTNPDEKLTVYGIVHARSVKVDLNGPLGDFVFDRNYRLAPLNQVNDYINKYHHLSEMPSAKEAATNGLNLGDMNQKLLQKVEELTLYLIQKDKADKLQAAKYTRLEQRLKAAEAKLKVMKTNTILKIRLL